MTTDQKVVSSNPAGCAILKLPEKGVFLMAKSEDKNLQPVSSVASYASGRRLRRSERSEDAPVRGGAILPGAPGLRGHRQSMGRDTGQSIPASLGMNTATVNTQPKEPVVFI